MYRDDSIRNQLDPWLWQEYYQAFPEVSPQEVRPGCHPRKMVHPAGVNKSIVLIHGLSDSPHFMEALGNFFFAGGYDVFIPLLSGHGLQSPDKLKTVRLEHWLQNVRYALDCAAVKGRTIAVGGLSMGAALGYYLAGTGPWAVRDLFLFSPALGLPASQNGLPGWLKEWLLLLPLAVSHDNRMPLIGKNPYRYSHVSWPFAVQLARLLQKIRRMPKPYKSKKLSNLRFFAAWSEFDSTVNLDKIKGLQQQFPTARFQPYVLPRETQVRHASVVLQEPIFPIPSAGGTEPLELANPCFSEMLAAISRFISRNGAE